MFNPKHHDWPTIQMLQFSPLNFYCLQGEIFLLKNGFEISFFWWRLINISSMILHLQPWVKHTLGEKITVLKNFNFHETLFSLIGWLYTFLKRWLPWINDFGDTYLCTTVKTKTEEYIHHSWEKDIKF